VCARRRAGKVYATMMRGPLIRIVAAMLVSGAATSAMAKESSRPSLRGSLGADVDAWPLGFAFEAGVWLDHDLWMFGGKVSPEAGVRSKR
jgi:hypothetical protein